MNEQTKIRNNRLVLLTIAGIPLLMILTATWLWYFVINGNLDLVGALGTANSGTLVQPPRQLDEYSLAEETGVPVKYVDLPRKWTLLVANNDGVCDSACESSLYLTRQIHIAMGKEFNRIGRMYVSSLAPADTRLAVETLSDKTPAPASFAAYLKAEHRGLKTLSLSDGGFASLFPEMAEDASTWYLVDPAGWVMMSYNSGINYKDVISDLKFLLKNSSE